VGARTVREELALKDRALSSCAEGITITDPRLPDNPLIYVNQGFEHLTGYTADEVLGRNCRFLQGRGSDSEAVAAIRGAVRAERPCLVEILNYRKDGSPFWNRLSVTPVRDAEGRTTHFIGIQSDISDRKRAEDGLREANRQLEIAAERKRRSLEAAAGIQRTLLPSVLPKLPGVRLAWQFRPCDELAGDTLNVIRLTPRHLALYVVDVSGHGVTAALLSVALSWYLAGPPGGSLLVTPAVDGSSEAEIVPPARVAEILNARFPLDTRTAQYFTLLYGVLDLATMEFRFVSAGHPPPIHVPRGGHPVVAEGGGPPIGILPEAAFEEGSLRLRPGDRLFLHTDGLTDVLDASEREFGRDGLFRAIEASRAASLAEASAQIVGAVEAWTSGSSRKDDITLLALEAEDGQPEASGAEGELSAR
jgi:phosphoserine phosphatase RsbU/P